MDKIKRLTRELSEAFTLGDAVRNGQRITVLKDDAPEWVTDAVYAAHGGNMPDDDIYAAAASIAEALDAAGCDDVDDLRDATHEIADSLVDVYTSELLGWLARDSSRLDYVDEAAREGLVEPDTDEVKRIMVGQYLWLREIGDHLVSAIEDQIDNDEE